MTTSTIPTRVSLPGFLNLELASKDEGLFSSLPLAILIPTPISNPTVASPTSSTFFPNLVISTLRSSSSAITTSPTNTSAGDNAIAPVLSVSTPTTSNTSSSKSSLNPNTPKAVTGNTQTSLSSKVASPTSPITSAIAAPVMVLAMGDMTPPSPSPEPPPPTVRLLDGRAITKFVNILPNLLTPGLFIDTRKGGTYTISIKQGLHNFGLGSAYRPTAAWGYHSNSAPLWDTTWKVMDREQKSRFKQASTPP